MKSLAKAKFHYLPYRTSRSLVWEKLCKISLSDVIKLRNAGLSTVRSQTDRGRGKLWKKVWGTSLLPQVVLILPIKPILNSILLKYIHSVTTMCLWGGGGVTHRVVHFIIFCLIFVQCLCSLIT